MPPALNQGRYYLFTIPYGTEFYPDQLQEGVIWMKGQREIGESGYDHWQVMMCFNKKMRPGGVRKMFPNIHNELVMSLEDCEQYVWKDETSVEGTRFEIGQKPLKRNSAKDWDTIRQMAQEGNLDDIDSSVYVCHYRSLKQIAVDHMKPNAEERTIKVFWGPTATGKSRRAWEEAGWDAFPKDPNSKFWDGYAGHENVVIDEFRGRIDISHVLRWFDRYPVIVEVKGTSQVFKAKNIWITSNLDPRNWYPDIDEPTRAALLRRFEIVYFPKLPPSVETPAPRRPITVMPVDPRRGHRRDVPFHLADETPCPRIQPTVFEREVSDSVYELGREMLMPGHIQNPIVIDDEVRNAVYELGRGSGPIEIDENEERNDF